MANFSPADDALTQWLRQRLCRERELLEKRHNALLDELQAHLKQQTESFTVLPLEDMRPDTTLEDVNPEMTTVQIEAENMEADNINDPDTREDQGVDVTEVPTRASFMDGMELEEDFPKNKVVSYVSFIGQKRPRKVPDTYMARLVTSRRFELFFAGLIFANMVEMALEMQYHGIENGFLIGYPEYTQPKEDVWPGMKTAFGVSNWMFGIMYTAELIMKVVGLRWLILSDCASVFDFFIVFIFYMEKCISSVEIPLNTMILRLFRLMRVLRLLRLVHEVAGLGQLLLMVTALKGSLRMLAWAAMLLVGLQTIFAFFLHVLLSQVVIETDNYSLATRTLCFKYFGTFSLSIFSMFELTLANWIPISRFLIEDISEFFVIFAIGYKLTLGFAVVGVVNACFIKETFKIVASDRTMMVIEKTNEKAAFVREMTRFMEHADNASDHDGTLTLEEFERVCRDETVRNWLGAQGLDASDARKLFELMDDGSGSLETPELVRGVAKLKGPAKSLDMVILSCDAQELLRSMGEFQRKLQRIEAEWTMKVQDPAEELANMPVSPPASSIPTSIGKNLVRTSGRCQVKI